MPFLNDFFVLRFQKTIWQTVRTVPSFFSDRWVHRIAFAVSFVLVVASVVLPAWRLLPAAYETKFIPLHYNIYFGIDRFGPWHEMFVPSAVGFLILIINIIIASHYFRNERMLSLFLCWLAVLAEAIVFVAAFFLVLVNV